MTGPGYFAPVVLPGAAPVPPPPAPPPRRRSSVPVVVLLLVVLGAVVASVVSATSKVQAVVALGDVIAVEEPAPAAAGWSAGYVDEDGNPGRWDPCEPIPFVVQAGWIPDAGRADLAEALRRLSEASGLRFVDEGDTDELPSRDRTAYQPERYGERWAPLLIGWLPAEATDVGLGGGVQGVSAAVAVPSTGGPSLVSGQVVLDASNRLAAGFGAGTTDGEVLLHELAHAVGLGHVLDPTQVMYPQTTSSESVFGAGDRAGLAAVGAAAGCHPAPSARPLRLEG
ncbi:MAG: matrixin family metalloprotease [Frankiaceae bacterium]|nr:matrixin family metalloprotease [Frankiaceae bacterium]